MRFRENSGFIYTMEFSFFWSENEENNRTIHLATLALDFIFININRWQTGQPLLKDASTVLEIGPESKTWYRDAYQYAGIDFIHRFESRNLNYPRVMSRIVTSAGE